MKATYKCRLCGELFTYRIRRPNSIMPIFADLCTKGASTWHSVYLLDYHRCVSNNYGIGDFQGFVEE